MLWIRLEKASRSSLLVFTPTTGYKAIWRPACSTNSISPEHPVLSLDKIAWEEAQRLLKKALAHEVVDYLKKFENTIEGDCLDTCGSNVKATLLSFKNCADKSISTGEATRATISNAVLNGSHIGIAVKDRSVVILKISSIKNVNIGVAVYTKKYSLGSAILKFVNSTIKNSLIVRSVEFKSTFNK
jgi:hypothetical protein